MIGRWLVHPVALAITLAAAPACGPGSSESPRACLADRDCEAGLVCARDSKAEGADGTALALTCDTSPDASIDRPCCQTAADCARGLCAVSGACLRPCIDGSDCAVTERCATVHVRGDDEALQSAQACTTIAEVPADVRVSTMDLADVIVTDPEGFAIDLPAVDGTAVFVLEHRSESLWPRTVECRTPLCVRELATRDASPTVLFDVAQLKPGSVAPLNTVNTSVDAFVSTILLPNGPRSVLSDAGYRVRLRSESPGDLAITELSRTGRGSVLDIHLHYVGADGLRPDGERGPPRIADALDHAETILAQAGMVFGDVCQTEVTGALAAELSTIEAQFGVLPQLPELMALSAGARGSAVHVYLVDQADIALGIAGGAPGPLGVHGTGSSGVVMSVALFDDATQLGRALAHELGHYFGLFHPIEGDGVVLDPLPATPRDATNLMARTASGGEQLTADQRDVVAKNPMLR